MSVQDFEICFGKDLVSQLNVVRDTLNIFTEIIRMSFQIRLEHQIRKSIEK